MCDYQGYEFGAGHYPDSVCIEGRLFDADACDGMETSTTTKRTSLARCAVRLMPLATGRIRTDFLTTSTLQKPSQLQCHS